MFLDFNPGTCANWMEYKKKELVAKQRLKEQEEKDKLEKLKQEEMQKQ